MKPIKTCLVDALILMHKRSSPEGKKRIESILLDIKKDLHATKTN